MNNNFRKRVANMDTSNLQREDTAKTLVTTAEDTYLAYQRLRKIDNHLQNINDYLTETEMDVDDTKERRRLLNRKQIRGVRFNVFEYESSYVGDIRFTTSIYHAQKLGMKLRALEIELNHGAVVMESGMFQSSEGNVELKQSFGAGHMLGGFIRKMNKESFFRPEFMGTGVVRLDSNFKFVHLMRIDQPTRLVLEKGIYLASAGDWKYKTAKNFNLGMLIFSDKTILQTELKGTGLVALELPVHPSELVCHKVTQDRPFRVSGEYVLYWKGNLKRKINPAKKLLGNLASGRGIIEEYTGEGYVYTAPTIGYYNTLTKDLMGKKKGIGSPLGDDVNLGKQSRSFWDKVGLRGNREEQE